MKCKLSLLVLLIPVFCQAQLDSARLVKEIQAFQDELNHEYKDKSTSPLKPADLRKFKEHDFFSTDLKLAVEAQLILTPDAKFEAMAATGPAINEYRSYAIAEFELSGEKCQLTLYQSKNLMNRPEYADYLFLPFTDKTTGDESYGGGRYLGLRIPKEGDKIIINFNLAYNPYCAYNEKYSCPLVPRVNDLPVAVRAGVRYASKDH